MARGPGGEVPDRRAGARAGRGRLQLRVPLPAADHRRRARWRSSSRSRARRPTRSARCAKRSGSARAVIAICNVVGSMATREADGTVYTHAGPEIGVASTKAFTCQLVALHLLAIALGQARGTLDARTRARADRTSSNSCRSRIEQALKLDDADQGAVEQAAAAPRLPLPRPRHQLSDRARRRAEAEGDLVHPRRGLSGRRNEARPDRAHRRGPAGRRGGGRRRGVREGAGQHPGSQGARRADDRRDERVEGAAPSTGFWIRSATSS